MSLILFHAGHNRISLVSQDAFPEKAEEGWDYRVGEHAIGHFEITECNWEDMEFQMVRWSGEVAETRILLRGGYQRCTLFAVIEGSCRIGWNGAGRQFHERAANIVEGIVGFLPIERQLPGNLTFIRIAFDKPAHIARDFDRKGWSFNRNLMITKSIFEVLTPIIVDHTMMPEASYLRVAILSLVAYLFSDAPLEYQRARIGLNSAAWFYEQKEKLGSQASFAGAFGELIERSGMDNLVRFRRLLRQLYSYRVRDLLREQRMRIAVGLLRSSDLSIKEVAALSGFRNVFYFTRVFADYFGEPPGAFQRRYRR